MRHRYKLRRLRKIPKLTAHQTNNANHFSDGCDAFDRQLAKKRL